MAFGEIIQVIGPSIDIKFGHDELPGLLNAVKVEYPDKGIDLSLEVAQQIGNNTVRCIALGSTDGLVRGMKVRDTGAPIKVPVGPQTLGRIFNVLGKPIDALALPIDYNKSLPIHRDAPSFEEQLAIPRSCRPGSRSLTCSRRSLRAARSVFSAVPGSGKQFWSWNLSAPSRPSTAACLFSPALVSAPGKGMSFTLS